MSYILKDLAAANEENVQTIAWLREHASLSTAETYAATIARELQEIVELPFAWPVWFVPQLIEQIEKDHA